MNELSTKTEKTMTTREVAEALGCAVNTVREQQKKYYQIKYSRMVKLLIGLKQKLLWYLKR